MVGKTSSRDKRARLNKGLRSTNTTEPAPNPRQSPSISQVGMQSHEAPISNFPIPDDFSFAAWGNGNSPDLMDAVMQTDMQDDMFSHGYHNFLTPESSTDANNPNNSASDFNLDLPNVDLDLDQYSLPDLNDLDAKPSVPSTLSPVGGSSSANYAKGPGLNQDTVLSRRLPQNLSVNRTGPKAPYAHVLALVEVIGSLEAQMQGNDTAVDRMLRLNKACLASVMKIVAQEDSKLCKSCRALVPTAMELIVSLYEKCLSKENGDGPSNKDQPNSSRRRSSSLQFGVFPIEPEDQIAFTNQLFTKELRRSIHIIQLFATQCREAAGGNANCGSVVWYTKMEQRAKNLITSLGG